MTSVSLVLRAVIRAAPAAFLSYTLVFSLCFYICCLVNNKVRKKEVNVCNFVRMRSGLTFLSYLFKVLLFSGHSVGLIASIFFPLL